MELPVPNEAHAVSLVLDRELLTGLVRTRIDVAFVIALLDESISIGAAKTSADALRRLDDLIAQLGEHMIHRTERRSACNDAGR